MNVIIRVDASAKMGTGHVMRCLTLAMSLQSHDANVTFVCRNHHCNLIEYIQAKGFTCKVLTGSDMSSAELVKLPLYHQWLAVSQCYDAEQTLQIIHKHADIVDLLIVDHYGLDYEWQQQMKSTVKKILVIDDLANRQHNCDYLLDQNLGHSEIDYRHIVPKTCELLLGPDYALLRPEFFQQRVESASSIEKKQLRRILISLGGGHFNQQLLSLMQAIHCANPRFILDVVLGTAATAIDVIEQYAQQHALTVNLYQHVDDMTQLILQADLAVGASGTSAWERCCLGLPSLLYTVADNQILIAEQLDKQGAAHYLGPISQFDQQPLIKLLDKLQNSEDILEKMSQAALSTCDGLGVGRATLHLWPQFSKQNQAVTLRKINAADSDMLFEWQTHPETRRYFHNTEIPSYEEHCSWFKNKLQSHNCIFNIIMCQQLAVGLLRLDQKDAAAQIYEIDVVIAPEYKKLGLAKAALLSLNILLPGFELHADVMPANTASHALFESAGFNFDSEKYVLFTDISNICGDGPKYYSQNQNNNYIVATVKPWNIKNFEKLTLTYPGNWHLLTQPDELSLELIKKIKPRYIFFPHWSWLVPKEILVAAECVCFHSSDLPYGRGGSPIQNLIIAGHSATQLCALRMTEELDAGPIYIKKPLSLVGSAQEIFERLSKIVFQMIREITIHEPTTVPQQGAVTVFARRKPKQSQMPTQGNLQQCFDHIRMLDADTYPHAYLEHGEFRYEFLQARMQGDKLTAQVQITKTSSVDEQNVRVPALSKRQDYKENIHEQ